MRWAAAGSPLNSGQKEPDDRRNPVCCRFTVLCGAPNVEVLILSRVLLGLAVGGPLIPHRCTSLKLRRKKFAAYDLDVSVDDHYRDPRRLSFCTAFSYTGAWRWMLGVIIIPEFCC